MSIFSKLFGGNHTASVKQFQPIVAKINSLEADIQKLSDAELKDKTASFKARLSGKTLEEEKAILADILPEAFALVREASRRTSGQRHFDVQLIGGMVLNSGGIAEMRTGEGKTLVATLPAYLNALTGRGVHVVTVNDYLSRRDAAWMGQIYHALGLSVAVINHESSFIYDPAHTTKADDKTEDELGSFKIVHEFLRPVTRREAYAADITYGTNNEFGFDYLRDNLEYEPEKLRQRVPNYVIVDEIDSILIDEARTPLIISAPTRDAESVYKQFASLVTTYTKDTDYTVDEKKKAIQLTDSGIEKAEKLLGINNLYTDAGIKFVHHLETAVKAKALYNKDVDYVIKNNEIVIVDTFTGRLQPGRRWSEGLHQAIEAKEGVSIQQESRTYASITFQNFFRMYQKLSGMTGTAVTSSEEFYKVYGLNVYQIPTNRTAVRIDSQDQIFQTEIGKFKAIARRVKELHAKGQPVLIGTVSIEKNELLSQFLKGEGVPHEMLNAKNHEREGEIVAQAGKKGAVTIATNMAGRGVDIKLGGNPNTPELYEEVKSIGGLFVLGTERHEARRIDDQLRGRAGRQGDPGETQFFVSMEDSLMRVFASDTMKSMMGKLGVKEDEPIQHSIISRSLENAQKKIEGFNFDSRKHVLEFDDVINSQRTSIYSKRRGLLLGDIDHVEKEFHDIVKLTVSEKAFNPFEAKDLARGFGSSSTEKLTADFENLKKLIEDKIKEFGREPFINAVRIILLQTIDMFWVEHLEVMDYTRSSVNLRAYGQRDPLIEYKKEGLRLFREMNTAIHDQFVRILPNIQPVNSTQNTNASQQLKGVKDVEFKEIHDNAQIIGAGDGSNKSGNGGAGVKAAPEAGRNDPCPCGSGKKYKKCHGVGK